jgi:hypothetical protein
VVGWQVEKWIFRENSFACEHNSMRAKDLGNGNILKKFAAVKFCCPGLGSRRAEMTPESLGLPKNALKSGGEAETGLTTVHEGRLEEAV